MVEVVIFLDFDFMYVYLEAIFVPEKYKNKVVTD